MHSLTPIMVRLRHKRSTVPTTARSVRAKAISPQSHWSKISVSPIDYFHCLAIKRCPLLQRRYRASDSVPACPVLREAVILR